MEEEKLVELQNLVIMERENFVRFIFNGSWNSVVHRENIDLKLLDYEQTVAVAATEGIDMETKDIIYKWTYIQAVFFTSTILTTIGKSGATEARKTEGVKSFFYLLIIFSQFSREKMILLPRPFGPRSLHFYLFWV